MMRESLSHLSETIIEIKDEREFLDEAFMIAKQKSITLYDALFIALAKNQGCSLLTLDRTQAKAALQLKVSYTLI